MKAKRESCKETESASEDKYYELITINRSDGSRECLIIPPLLKQLLVVIAENEEQQVSDVVLRVVRERTTSGPLLDTLKKFAAVYTVALLDSQCENAKCLSPHKASTAKD